MNIEPNQPELPTALTAEVHKQYLNLHPYTELAKHVMESPACEINIIDAYYQGSVTQNMDEFLHNDTINQNKIL